MTTLTPTLLQKREVLRTLFKQGIKPADNRRPIPEELAQQMVQDLIDSGFSKDSKIGVIDTFLTLTLTLQEHGFTNIVVLENEHRNLTSLQQKYYNTIKGACEKIGVTYYVPPMNNWKRCDMDFDAIIGNPPYQGDSDSKRWVLWHQFLELALTQSNHVSYIIPASITSPGKMWNMIRNNLVKIDFTVGQHFKGVGSTFCRIVVDKNHTGETNVITDTETLTLDVSSYDFLPPVVNSHNMSLYSRFTNNREWKISTEYHTSKKSKWSDDNGEIEVWHTNAQTLRTNTPHPNNNLIRVGVTLSGYPEFKVMNKVGGSQVIVYTVCDTVEEAQQLANYLNGPDIQEVLSVFKWSGWNKLEVIKLLG
jgi:hypothetical protein